MNDPKKSRRETPTTIERFFRDTVVQAMEAQGMSYPGLASRADVKLGTLYNMLSFQHFARISMWQKLFDALGLELGARQKAVK